MHGPVRETFEQVYTGKTVVVEQVLVQSSVSEAITDEKLSNDQHTGRISASRGVRVKFSRFSCVITEMDTMKTSQ